jgi:hypothetical protein
MTHVEQYFERGYIISKLPDNLLSKLWAEIYTTDWLQDPEGVYKGKPSWYNTKKYNIEEDGSLQNLVEKTYGSELIINAPDTLLQTANDIVKLNDFNFIKSFKDNIVLKYLHMWNGAEEIPWHYDTIDGSDILVFVYLTDTINWLDEYGGRIEFCKEINGQQFYTKQLSPKNGTMVIVNNTNPLFKHKVEKMKDMSVNRYTFSFCFKCI